MTRSREAPFSGFPLCQCALPFNGQVAAGWIRYTLLAIMTVAVTQPPERASETGRDPAAECWPCVLWGGRKVDREGQKPCIESHEVGSSYTSVDHKVERPRLTPIVQRGWGNTGESRAAVGLVRGDDEVTLVRGAASPLSCPPFATRRSQDWWAPAGGVMRGQITNALLCLVCSTSSKCGAAPL